MPNLAEIQKRLGYQFRDENLLQLALTHPSVAHESGEASAHNQRLEFLGDAVLQLILTQKLYEQFSSFDEGPLTKGRAKLVNRRSLTERARALALGPQLILSRGEDAGGGRERSSILADAFEALLGALYLDGGLAAVRKFVLQEFSGAFDGLGTIPTIENPKGELQELLQSQSPEAPAYRVIAITGLEHDRVFECTVHHGGVELARGSGKSKKAAESDAALAALIKLRSFTS